LAIYFGLEPWKFYFDELSSYWIDKCTDGEITEEALENKLDDFEMKSAVQLKRIWEKLKGNTSI
jgi:hypothetical protein